MEALRLRGEGVYRGAVVESGFQAGTPESEPSPGLLTHSGSVRAPEHDGEAKIIPKLNR